MGDTTVRLEAGDKQIGYRICTRGIFITLGRVQPSRNVMAEIAQAGKLTIGATDYPRLQLWSIQDYFDGMEPKLPAMRDPFTGKQIQKSIFD